MESLLGAAFVRLSTKATQRKQYRAIAQSCETMDYLANRRPALEKELRSRIGVEGRLADFVEDALTQQRVAPESAGGALPQLERCSRTPGRTILPLDASRRMRPHRRSGK